MRTTAKIFVAVADQLPRDERGFAEIPSGFISAWRRTAAEISFPFGDDSHDSTESWTFADGSMAKVSNPSQSSFSLGVSAK